MKKKILYLLALFCVLIFASFLVLKNGISISSVQFDFLKLEQLYIKLDKKLILRAKNIVLNSQNQSQNNTESSLKELLEFVKNIDLLYFFVQEIDIANLSFKQDKLRILFKNDDFLIDNHAFFLRLNLQKPSQHLLNADIKKFLFKDYNLSVEGVLSIDTKSEFYHLNAKANSHLADFNASISYKKNQLSYELSNLNAKDISAILNAKSFQEQIKLPKHIIWLLTKGIKAQKYELSSLKGFADLKKKKFYLNEFEAEGFLQNVELRLEEHMQSVKIPALKLSLKEQKLDLNFDKASYKGADLSGSKIYFYELFNENIGMFLHLKSSNFTVDEKLLEALKIYGLTLPFYQKSGILKADFKLKMNFLKDFAEYEGVFEFENSALSLLDFNTSKALLNLKQNHLSIKNAKVKNDFLEGEFDANIDLSTKNGVFDAQISRLYNEFINLRNERVELGLDFSNFVKILVPKWGLEMSFKNGLEASLSKISALIPHSSLLQKFKLKNVSNAYYKSENFKDFTLQIDDAEFESDFLTADKKPYQKDSFSIKNLNETMQISSKSNLISANLDKTKKEIHINNLTYIYKKSEKSGFELEKENIIFGGANFGIILNDMNKTLEFDRLEASLNKGVINAKANKDEADFRLFYSNDDLKLEAKNMNDKFINTFLQKEAVESGVFNLQVSGSGMEFFEGKFTLKETFLKDLKVVNTLISFIDTVPSLLLFKPPSFNQKGLSLSGGEVVFKRKKDLLTVKAINLKGDSVDIFGLGSANLRLQTLDFDLELKTLKSASSVISKVPFINYVILGKDQEISTILKIDGSFDEPKFHTQILSDTLKMPFNLIKNIIQLPMNLFQ